MDNKDKKIIGYDNMGFPIYEGSAVINNNNNNVVDNTNKKKKYIMNVIKILIVLVLFYSLLVRCSCTRFYRLDSDKTILEKTNNYITGERFELVSSKKFQHNPDGKRFKFRSLERNLEFEMTVILEQECAGLCYWTSNYYSTYYQEINKIYETQVLEAIKKYYNDSQFVISNSNDGGKTIESDDYFEHVSDEGLDIMVEIKTKDDIDNYIKLVNDINEIYSAENEYNGIIGIDVCAKEKIYEDDYCSSMDIYDADIDGKTTYSSDDVNSEIYQKLVDECILVDGIDITCSTDKIKKVYLNNQYVTYNSSLSKIVYFEDRNNYYVLVHDFDGHSFITDYLDILGIPYKETSFDSYVKNGIEYLTKGTTITFEKNGNKYEISNGQGLFEVLINGKEYSCSYRYDNPDSALAGYLSIDDFVDILGLTYEIKNLMYFTSLN